MKNSNGAIFFCKKSHECLFEIDVPPICDIGHREHFN